MNITHGSPLTGGVSYHAGDELKEPPPNDLTYPIVVVFTIENGYYPISRVVHSNTGRVNLEKEVNSKGKVIVTKYHKAVRGEELEEYLDDHPF